jgi:hypothetical protein
VIERHFSHDLGRFHYGEVVRHRGLSEVEILTYPTHVGGVVILSDHGHDEVILNVRGYGEEAIRNAHASGGEAWEVVIALMVVLQTRNADSLLDRENETFWTVQEIESADEAEETEKETCGVERLFHVAGFGSCDHAPHDSLLVDP